MGSVTARLQYDKDIMIVCEGVPNYSCLFTSSLLPKSLPQSLDPEGPFIEWGSFHPSAQLSSPWLHGQPRVCSETHDYKSFIVDKLNARKGGGERRELVFSKI